MSLDKNQQVVVLGGAGLLGSAVSLELAARGFGVIVADVNAEAAQNVCDVLTKQGLKGTSWHVDACLPADVRDLASHLSRLTQPISAIVNATYPSGRSLTSSELSHSSEPSSHAIHAHLGSFVSATETLGELLVAQGSGSFVNVVSIYAQSTPRFEMYTGTDMSMPVDYAVSKAGIVALTRYFAKRHLKSGVRFNCVAPGGVRANQPREFQERYDAYCGLRGLLNPQDVCGTVAFLASDDSRFMTGQTLTVDDGWSL